MTTIRIVSWEPLRLEHDAIETIPAGTQIDVVFPPIPVLVAEPERYGLLAMVYGSQAKAVSTIDNAGLTITIHDDTAMDGVINFIAHSEVLREYYDQLVAKYAAAPLLTGSAGEAALLLAALKGMQ